MMNPKIDFYILPEPSPSNYSKSNPLMIACLLCEKAFLSAKSVHLLCQNEEQGQQLNDLLWKFKQIAFIPHTDDFNSKEAVVISATRPDEKNRIRDVIINLSDLPVDQGKVQGKTQIKRVLEIISFDKKSIGRSKFLSYKALNLNPDVHQL